MKNPWSDLPNAKHIDRVIANFRWNAELWSKIPLDPARELARRESFASEMTEWIGIPRLIHCIVCDQSRNADQKIVAGLAAMSTIAGLVAYDDCAYMLESVPGELAILAKFGDAKALLMLPACTVFFRNGILLK